MRARVLLAVLVLPALFSACAEVSGRRMTAEEYERFEQLERNGAVQDDAQRARTERERQDELNDDERELEGDLSDARFAATELLLKRERMLLQHQTSQEEAGVALQRASLEREHAAAKLSSFEARVRPRRLEAAALDLTEARSDLLETREELAQLELMYAGSELGEGTAEIVMERTRRAIVLLESRLALTVQEEAELREVELPMEHAELKLALVEAQVELATAERARVLAGLEADAELRELEHERASNERRLDTLGRRMLELESKVREDERSRVGRAFPGDGR